MVAGSKSRKKEVPATCQLLIEQGTPCYHALWNVIGHSTQHYFLFFKKLRNTRCHPTSVLHAKSTTTICTPVHRCHEMYQDLSRWQTWQRNWQSYRVRRCIVADCSIRPDHTIMFWKTICYSQRCKLLRFPRGTAIHAPINLQEHFVANTKTFCCIYRCCAPACLTLNQSLPQHFLPSWSAKQAAAEHQILDTQLNHSHVVWDQKIVVPTWSALKNAELSVFHTPIQKQPWPLPCS